LAKSEKFHLMQAIQTKGEQGLRGDETACAPVSQVTQFLESGDWRRVTHQARGSAAIRDNRMTIESNACGTRASLLQTLINE
jgi:hypothetical protein